MSNLNSIFLAFKILSLLVKWYDVLTSSNCLSLIPAGEKMNSHVPYIFRKSQIVDIIQKVWLIYLWSLYIQNGLTEAHRMTPVEIKGNEGSDWGCDEWLENFKCETSSLLLSSLSRLKAAAASPMLGIVYTTSCALHCQKCLKFHMVRWHF